MKKFILLIGGVVLSVISFGQVAFGVQASGSLASATVKSKYDLDFDKKFRGTPSGGGIVQVKLGRNISLRSGLIFSQQGVTVKHAEDEFGSVTSKTRLNYLQVPVHAVYAFPVAPGALYVGLGGYAGYGISGEIKNTLWFYTDDGGYEFVEKLKAFKKSEEDGGNLQRADYGLSGIAGLQLRNGFFVQAGYQRGLANISRDKEDTYRNNGLQLTIGYFFK